MQRLDKGNNNQELLHLSEVESYNQKTSHAHPSERMYPDSTRNKLLNTELPTPNERPNSSNTKVAHFNFPNSTELSKEMSNTPKGLDCSVAS